eukprot:GHVU01013516.1.p1 GENE.GHVU01013516.1~~GHVU01013516.1.p1  ORF type:complete len:214 (+),score=12.84 GHVU01013516.1:208-849(+)
MACSPLMNDEELGRFRTKLCNRQISTGCEFSRRCQYSHNRPWPRRCPYLQAAKQPSKQLRYIPMFCPNISLSYDCEIISNDCTNGSTCSFAHSAEEVLYHPIFYKTRRCPTYTAATCTEYYCPFIHAQTEDRKPGIFALPSGGIPPIPGVVVPADAAQSAALEGLSEGQLVGVAAAFFVPGEGSSTSAAYLPLAPGDGVHVTAAHKSGWAFGR